MKFLKRKNIKGFSMIESLLMIASIPLVVIVICMINSKICIINSKMSQTNQHHNQVKSIILKKEIKIN